MAADVDASQVVPGDIVLLQAGDRVPADGRLFQAATLEIEESALTGESVASPKNTDVIDNPDAPLGDRHDMAYMNTGVTRGSAEMIVTTTGMGTQMGSIATLLNKTESDKTPLQKQLDKLTKIIAGLAGIAFVIMIILGHHERRVAGHGLRCRHRSGDCSHPHRFARGRDHHVFHGRAGAGRAREPSSSGCPRWRRWARSRPFAPTRPAR